MIVERSVLLDVVGALPFDSGQWVVAGSAPMLMAGLVDSISDIDLVVDATAWQRALSLYDEPPREGLHGDHMVEMQVGDAVVEIFDGWLGTEARGRIAEAVEIEGQRFSPLERVLDSKRRLIRPKDRRHIAILEAHLGRIDRQAPPADGH